MKNNKTLRKPIQIKGKKAQSIMDIFVFMIIIFLLVVGFVVFKFAFHTATVKVQAIDMPTNIVNFSQVTNQTFVALDTGLNQLQWLGLAIIIGMMLNILLSNFLIKSHPAFFILYICIVVLGIIISIFISNEYQNIVSSTILHDTFKSFGTWDIIMTYLPVWITVVGFMGGLFLFMGILRDSGQGGAF